MSETPDSQPKRAPHAYPGPFNAAISCRDLDDNVAAFVLGALDPDELRVVDDHRAICPRCAHVVVQAMSTVSFLPFLSPSANPPTSAKSALMDRIVMAPAAGPPALQRLPNFGADRPPITIPSSRDALTLPLAGNRSGETTGGALTSPSRRARPRWEFLVAPLAALPLVLTLAIVGGWAMNAQHRIEDQSAALAANAVTISNLETAQKSSASVLPVSSTTQSVSLQPAEDSAASKAGGLISVQPGSSHLTLAIWGMPQFGRSFDVQVETMDGRMIVAGQGNTDSSGNASAIVLNLPHPLNSYRSVRVVSTQSNETSSRSDSWPSGELLAADLISTLADSSNGTDANANPN